ncbi:CoA pyrophosphatase [Neisseria sp.]|uniref:NUDIX hydrolase n=1 Tax=Neisseria sp. TaxID=192066 RepID=UPI00359FA05E
MNTDRLVLFLQQAAAIPLESETQRLNMFEHSASKEAAVLIGIVAKQSGWHILLTRRADNLRHHSGQISFAGGRMDVSDDTPETCALRETYEETGIPAEAWQTFPALPCLATPSGYRVHPVPALCRHNPPVFPNPDEVAEIIYLPLDDALDLARYTSRTAVHRGQTLHTPQLPYLNHDIWGLTALILKGLAERLQRWQQAV